jgi:hypothetical protein
MSKETLQQKYSKKLESFGARKQNIRSSKYIAYFLPSIGGKKNMYIFIGRNGAVRWHETDSATKSEVVPNWLMKLLKEDK